MNHLIYEKSPYLLQHRNNPIDWYPWGEEALERAVREAKPIFLSIGYSTCHWCHVMAHESFEDKEVAGILNQDYICIKVDREERPDLDAVYMSACQAVNHSGGWPLTAILTPDQNPFFIGTYFPKNEKYGQPGLLSILQKISMLWKNRRKELINTGIQVAEFIAKDKEALPGVPHKGLIKEAAHLYWQQYDWKWGGFGSAPKFPTPHNLLFLLYYSRIEEPDAMELVEGTLMAMARGGIFDQIGGGFSRYSTDEKWLAPHFEKMLYDNALLSLVYLEAYHGTRKTIYAEIASRTLNYILRELTGPRGEFLCSQDADSDGVEGKYYVFTPDEVIGVLGKEDGEKFCKSYGITKSGNFQGKSIPNRIGSKEPLWEEQDPRLQRLYHYRQNRTRLHRDDKTLLSWSGWAVMAMAKAFEVMGKPEYLNAAVGAEQFIRKHMTGKDGKLFLRWREGEAAQAGQLDDYAVYGLALLELYQATWEPSYLNEAVLRAGQMIALFEDREKGGFFLTSWEAEQLIARPKETYDGGIPSGNSAAAVLLGRLSLYRNDALWNEAAERQIRFLTGAIRDYPAGSGFGLVSLLEHLYPSRQLVCVTSSSEIPKELKTYLQENLVFNLLVILKTGKNTLELEKAAPFTKHYPVPETGTCYYLCQNGMCMRPETEFSKLNL